MIKPKFKCKICNEIVTSKMVHFVTDHEDLALSHFTYATKEETKATLASWKLKHERLKQTNEIPLDWPH